MGAGRKARDFWGVQVPIPSAPVKIDPPLAAAQLNGPCSVFFTSTNMLLQVPEFLSYLHQTNLTERGRRAEQMPCRAGLSSLVAGWSGRLLDEFILKTASEHCASRASPGITCS